MITRKHIVLSVLFVFCLFLTVFPAIAQEGRIVRETIHSPSLEGNLLGDSPDRQVTIYLPPSYDAKPERRYPAVYLLHGYTGNNELWMGGSYASVVNIRTSADEWIRSGKMQPMILVMPNSYNRVWGSWYANSTTTGQWEDYIIDNLIQYVDTHYRTLPQKQSRAIAGHSMGGYGALRLGQRHPELFGAVGAMDPGFLDYETFAHKYRYDIATASKRNKLNDFDSLPWMSQVWLSLLMALAPNPTNPPFYCDFPWYYDVQGKLAKDEKAYARLLEQDVISMIEHNPNDLRNMRALCLIAATGNVEGLPMVRTLHEALNKHGITHVYEEIPGTHVSMLMRATEMTLETFSDAMAFEPVVGVKSKGKFAITWGEIRRTR